MIAPPAITKAMARRGDTRKSLGIRGEKTSAMIKLPVISVKEAVTKGFWE